MAAQQSRYLGVQPFKTSDKHIFFGRDEDIINLLDTILLEKLIVLFGKSGYGKSSLLNAGIVPLLSDSNQTGKHRFHPIEVRFTSFSESQSLEPIKIMQRLLKDIPVAQNEDCLKKLNISETLWGQFKKRQSAENEQFVLIFDQFEEFFSYPSVQQEVFRKQLSELLYADIPQAAWENLNKLTDEERRFIATPMIVKAVFAIREDRMSFLDSMKIELPQILHKRYKLNPLSIEQAKLAITRPALKEGDFLSPPFEYTETGLQAIIKALTTTVVDGKTVETSGVEAFQLQIVCEYIESLVKEGNVPDLDGNGLPDITEMQLPEMTQLYENYYHRKLSELSKSAQIAAQLVLEDGLLAEDSSTGESLRMSVDSRALIGLFRQVGLTDDLLLDLEKTYLIRREANTVGGFSFEISHDTLVTPIQKAKTARREKEKKIYAEQEQQEKERLLVEAQLQAKLERKRRQTATALAVLSGLLFLISTIIGIYAWQQTKEAISQRKIADSSNLLAKHNELKAQENADSAILARIEAEKNYNLALEQKGIASTAFEQAKNNLIKAQEKEKIAIKALADVKIAQAKNVLLILKEADVDIYNIRYEQALEKCKVAIASNTDGVERDSIKLWLSKTL